MQGIGGVKSATRQKVLIGGGDSAAVLGDSIRSFLRITSVVDGREITRIIGVKSQRDFFDVHPVDDEVVFHHAFDDKSPSDRNSHHTQNRNDDTQIFNQFH